MPYAEQIRIAWLEIYGDIFQKFAFLVLSSYVLVRLPWFRSVFSTDNSRMQDNRQRIFLVSAFSLLGILGSGVGFLRYGASDWYFMDLYLIFTVICGLISGLLGGLVCGVIGVVFRSILIGFQFQTVLILLAAGLLGGILSDLRRGEAPKRWSAFFAASFAGLFQGVLLYWSLWKSTQAAALLGILFSLVVLEGLSVYIFMAVAIGLVQDERRKNLERILPQMKLKFLQAQINPHFLFNALNTIAAVCSREKAEHARELVVKLSNFFRRIVKQEGDWVTLEEELSHIESYLAIEKARYQDRLKIQKDIKLSSRGANAKLPVLIIQPIVENAIKHGIAPKSEGAALTISAWENGKYVEILVKDQGVGIEETRLREIQAGQQTDDGEGAGVGLRNINERLRYHFGVDSQLKISSAIGQGTAVQFKIPLTSVEKE